MDNKKKIAITVVIVAIVIAIAIIVFLLTKNTIIAIAIIVFLLTKNTNTLHTISFDTNGGIEVATQKIEDGQKVSKPADPTKEGYTFLGWYLDGEKFDFETPVEDDMNLEAKWEEIIVDNNTDLEDDKDDEKDNDDEDEEKVTKYTVKFDSNGGSSVSKQTIEKNKTAKAPKNPTREGYIFKGWYLGNKKFSFSTKITKNITLKAKWEKVEEVKPVEPSEPEAKKYTVTFNSDGGSTVANKTVEENKTVAKPSDPTKSGYTFLGWYLGNTKFDFSTKITSNITLTAKWEKNKVVSYVVEDIPNSVISQVKIFVTEDGVKVAGTIEMTSTSGKKATINVPATGYTTVKGTYSSLSNPKVK